MRIVDDCIAVALGSKNWLRSKNSARFDSLMHADRCIICGVGGCAVERILATIEVQERDLVAQPCVLRDGSSATVFRVTRMTTRHDDIEGRARLGVCPPSIAGGPGEADQKNAARMGRIVFQIRMHNAAPKLAYLRQTFGH